MEKSLNKIWRITGFYGCPERSGRLDSWKLLKRLGDQNRLPWVVIGDFNEILGNSEKMGKALRAESQMASFREALEFHSLRDLGFRGQWYTWDNRRLGLENIKERLDRAVANPEWTNIFSEAGVQHLFTSASDHCPILLHLFTSILLPRRKRQFRFEQAWCRVETCEETVKESWHSKEKGSHMFEVTESIKSCRRGLINWERSVYRHSQLRMHQLGEEAKLLEERAVTEEDQYQLKKLHEELNELLEREEIAWRQRSRVQWLQEGNRNTKFFHNKATQRRKKNTIESLVDDHGTKHEEQQRIEQLIVDYFSQIYTSSNPQNLEPIMEAVETSVTEDMNTRLSQEFTATEVVQALHQMYPTKAPGPDGMSALFYQKYWHVVGPKVNSAVLEILNSGHMLKKINYTHIALIPKKTDPQKMTEYRPISLCNVIYKLVSKVLANRLKTILPQVISVFQSAFVPGRQITDNVLVAFEVMHHLNKKNKRKVGQMALKLDMNKAYDRVEWSFVHAIMKKMGFNDKWVTLIMECISTVSYSVLINGEPKGLIHPSRGLRQGDPLSPYIFLLCAEGLSALLVRVEQEKKIQGVKVARAAPAISHLFFADDSILFCQATREACTTYKRY